jgi:predicted DNA-binding protein (MmcQ/YjbR family)
LTKRELIDYCLTLSGSYEDYPFSDDTGWAAIRHKSNKKTFAFIYERNGELCINLKCEPMWAEFLRNSHNYIFPAYHMNKEHWNTVLIMENSNFDEIKNFIAHSYRLTFSKDTKKG